VSLQILPTFEDYTIDIHLKQFRKVTKNKIRFINFDSVEGEKLLLRYIKKLDSNDKELKQFIRNFRI